jgi:hypothetical protein
MLDQDVAWLAGLYEGEGSLLPTRRRGRVDGWRLSITMTDEDIVRRVHGITGRGSVIPIPRQRDDWKDAWRWGVNRRDHIAVIVRALLPYLGKRRSADVAEFLRWYDDQPALAGRWALLHDPLF